MFIDLLGGVPHLLRHRYCCCCSSVPATAGDVAARRCRRGGHGARRRSVHPLTPKVQAYRCGSSVHCSSRNDRVLSARQASPRAPTSPSRSRASTSRSTTARTSPSGEREDQARREPRRLFRGHGTRGPACSRPAPLVRRSGRSSACHRWCDGRDASGRHTSCARSGRRRSARFPPASTTSWSRPFAKSAAAKS